jgi:membrane-associated PAP2 superfamily phosphatase
MERLIKAFKTHCAEIDFDAGCVNGFVRVLQGISTNSWAITIVISKALCLAIFIVFFLFELQLNF